METTNIKDKDIKKQPLNKQELNAQIEYYKQQIYKYMGALEHCQRQLQIYEWDKDVKEK